MVATLDYVGSVHKSKGQLHEIFFNVEFLGIVRSYFHDLQTVRKSANKFLWGRPRGSPIGRTRGSPFARHVVVCVAACMLSNRSSVDVIYMAPIYAHFSWAVRFDIPYCTMIRMNYVYFLSLFNIYALYFISIFRIKLLIFIFIFIFCV